MLLMKSMGMEFLQITSKWSVQYSQLLYSPGLIIRMEMGILFLKICNCRLKCCVHIKYVKDVFLQLTWLLLDYQRSHCVYISWSKSVGGGNSDLKRLIRKLVDVETYFRNSTSLCVYLVFAVSPPNPFILKLSPL